MNDYLKEHKIWWPVSSELMASYNDGSHTKKYDDGNIEWHKNGKLHRDGDKPARIWADGSLGWYKNGEPHRDSDKPAVIYSHGSLWWYKNGEFHRVTGPAVIRPYYEPEYWINGVDISEEVEFWLKTRQYKYPFTPEQQVEFTLTFS
jgi:hypothetical protein